MKYSLNGYDMNSKLIIIRGNSASGKSTVARLVQKKATSSVAVIEQDYFRHDLFGSKWGDTEYQARSSVMADMTIRLLQSGVTVILEGSLPSKWFSGVLAVIRAEWHGDVASFCYVLDLEETLRRHQTRDKRTHFDEATLREWYTEHDKVAGLQEVTFGAEITPDQAARRVLDKIERRNESDRKDL